MMASRPLEHNHNGGHGDRFGGIGHNTRLPAFALKPNKI